MPQQQPVQEECNSTGESEAISSNLLAAFCHRAEGKQHFTMALWCPVCTPKGEYAPTPHRPQHQCMHGLVGQQGSADGLGKIMIPAVLFYKLHGQLEVTAWELQIGVLLQTPTQC